MTTTITWRTDEPPRDDGEVYILTSWAEIGVARWYERGGWVLTRGTLRHNLEVRAWSPMPRVIEPPQVPPWRHDDSVAKEQST